MIYVHMNQGMVECCLRLRLGVSVLMCLKLVNRL